jgi:hypothetical protein
VLDGLRFVRPSISTATLASLTFMLASSACHHTDEGPAESVGAKVDEGARNTKDAVKDSAHDVKKDVEDK